MPVPRASADRIAAEIAGALVARSAGRAAGRS